MKSMKYSHFLVEALFGHNLVFIEILIYGKKVRICQIAIQANFHFSGKFSFFAFSLILENFEFFAVNPQFGFYMFSSILVNV